MPTAELLQEHLWPVRQELWNPIQAVFALIVKCFPWKSWFSMKAVHNCGTLGGNDWIIRALSSSMGSSTEGIKSWMDYWNVVELWGGGVWLWEASLGVCPSPFVLSLSLSCPGTPPLPCWSVTTGPWQWILLTILSSLRRQIPEQYNLREHSSFISVVVIKSSDKKQCQGGRVHLVPADYPSLWLCVSRHELRTASHTIPIVKSREN